MTTPLQSKPYEDTGAFSLVILGVYPLVALIWANLGSVIADSAKEENEQVLENILKRIGYRPIVEVYRSFIVMLITIALLYTPVAILILMLLLPTVNVFIGLVFFYMIPIEMWIIDMCLNYVFGKRALIFKALYYITSLFLAIVCNLRPIMTNQKLTSLCLFPLT